MPVTTHDGLIVLPAVKYPENFDRIVRDLVGEDDAPSIGNDAQTYPKVRTRPALFKRKAKQIAAPLNFLDKTKRACWLVLRDDSIDGLKVLCCVRPISQFMRHDGAPSPPSDATF